MKITHYELSSLADKDLEDVFDYTLEEFGLDQAISYLQSIEKVLQQLIVNPDLGRERPDIRTGLRSFPKGSHVIFYRIQTDVLKVVRVLHGSRDVLRFLE